MRQVVRDFLESRESLTQQGLRKHSGLFISRKYTGLVDRFIRSLVPIAGTWDQTDELRQDRLALVALGGYGRGELCFGSDVDLLFIHQGRLSPDITETITRVLYPLWDAKLEVGHTVLNLQECVRLAKRDFRFQTSVMDARFLMGSSRFFQTFLAAFWSGIEREKRALLNQLLIYEKKREEKFSGQAYFVEPDVKEGLGGLRDFEFMAWIARIHFNLERLSEIRRLSLFSYFDTSGLVHSKSFLLKVRNQLHLIAGRKEDRLLLPYQKDISLAFGYREKASQTVPEKLMRHVYLHINRIRYTHEEFQEKMLDILDPKPFRSTPSQLSPEFRITKGHLVLKEDGLLKKDPLLILRAFSEANQRGLFLGSDLIQETKKSLAVEGKRFTDIPGAKDLFLALFFKPSNPKILRLALEIGLISLFIPEFKKIRNLPKLSLYHEETVDLHSLKTLKVIDDISNGFYDKRWSAFRVIFQELKQPRFLFLAGLLHDIGKGYRGDHPKKGGKLIRRVLRRLGLTGEVLNVVPFLVEHHLLLADISQRRDLNEERTSIEVAQTLENEENLKLLFLLTIADSIATGPMTRSDWKISLLIELYLKGRHILMRGTLASPDITKRLDERKKRLEKLLRPHTSKKQILALMDQISPRYFLNTPLETMSHHFRLALGMGDKKLNWILQKVEDISITRVILCTYDSPGLFSKMVGVFALNNIEVLSAYVFTLKNGLAFDIYEVTNPLDPLRETEQWTKIYGDIISALDEKFPLDSLMNRKRQSILMSKEYYGRAMRKAEVNNGVSDFFTGIEVNAEARVGLLYELAKKISSLGLDIRFAKVNRDKEWMYGVFYVRDSDGQKVLDEDEIKKIEQGILSVMA
jgi:[protein-PII] uridylyltransferase